MSPYGEDQDTALPGIFATYKEDLQTLANNVRALLGEDEDSDLRFGDVHATITFVDLAGDDIDAIIRDVDVSEDADAVLEIIEEILKEVDANKGDFMMIVTLEDRKSGADASLALRIVPDDSDTDESTVELVPTGISVTLTIDYDVVPVAPEAPADAEDDANNEHAAIKPID